MNGIGNLRRLFCGLRVSPRSLRGPLFRHSLCGRREPSRPLRVSLLVACIAVVLFGSVQCARSAEKASVRQAAVAGSFYPGDPKQLARTVDDLLARAGTSEITEPIVAVVSPHAGYPYSGAVAANSYAVLKGHKYQRVVVIAPSHYEGFDFTSVFNGDTYSTPLGNIAIDKEFAAALVKQGGSSVRLSTRGHARSGEQGEHALEVQLPFLQRALGDFHLVPIVMGDQSYDSSRALGVALAKLLRGKQDTLIVASSDLSHYHPYDQAVKLDHKTLKAIEEWDYMSLSRNFEARVWEACGGAPIVAAMIAAERLGANQARLLRYANSGDVTGDKSRVVGYGSVVFTQSAQKNSKPQPFSLNSKERDELLKLAKQSTETAVRSGGKNIYAPSESKSDSLLQERGAFVTLKKRGELRGCIGYSSAIKPLYLATRDTAVFAALRDPRFSPVVSTELSSLEYEISVLSPMRRVTDIKQIKIGEHGLLLHKGQYEGIFLPQVPVEQRWDRTTYLEQLAVKAGLPPQAWKDEDTDIFMFTTVVFGDEKRDNPVKDESLPFPNPASPTAQPPSFPPR